MDGRKALVDIWSTFLPTYADPFTIIGTSLSVGSHQASLTGSGTQNLSIPTQQWGTDGGSPGRPSGELETEEEHDDEDDGEGIITQKNYFLI